MAHTPDSITKCTCGKKVSKICMERHFESGDHRKCFKLTPDDTILPPSIIINNVTFNICDICEMCIHYKKML